MDYPIGVDKMGAEVRSTRATRLFPLAIPPVNPTRSIIFLFG
jgi:hypothetical protein